MLNPDVSRSLVQRLLAQVPQPGPRAGASGRQRRLVGLGTGALAPLLFRQVQQRGDLKGFDEVDGWHDQARGSGAGAVVTSALQDVLDLQFQLWGQISEIDAGGSDEFAVGDEAVEGGAAVTVPPVIVARRMPALTEPDVVGIAESAPDRGRRAVAVLDRTFDGR